MKKLNAHLNPEKNPRFASKAMQTARFQQNQPRAQNEAISNLGIKSSDKHLRMFFSMGFWNK